MSSTVLKRKRNHAIDLLEQIISIPSSNPHVSDKDETEIARFLKEELENSGIQTEFQPVTSKSYWAFGEERTYTRPNVIARIGSGSGKKLILNGHIDTVSGETMKGAFEARVIGDRLYGRGSSDMKGGVAAIVAATEAIQESRTRLGGELVLSLVVDEETSGRGTIEFIESEKGDFAIIAEPTENTLGIAQSGFLDFNVYSKGESRHGQTAVPNLWASAFVQATDLCSRILEDKMIIRKKRRGGLDMVTTFNYSPTKYVPPSSYAWMTMEEFRVNCLLGIIPETTVEESKRSAKKILNLIKKHAIDANREGQKNKIEVVAEKVGFFQADNFCTEEFERAMDKILGRHQRSYVLSFCDASYFYYANIPTILFGPGEMRLGHSTNEYVSIRQVKDATSVFTHAIKNILGELDPR